MYVFEASEIKSEDTSFKKKPIFIWKNNSVNPKQY